MGEVSFNYQQKVHLRDRQLLKAFILSIFKKEKKKAGSISYVFCDDAFILDINQQFLDHNYYTDIITFDLSEAGSGITDAEIYISIETVRTNAAIFSKSFTEELHRVIFHGILHLCGYKDKSKAEELQMRQKEDYYLKEYFQQKS